MARTYKTIVESFTAGKTLPGEYTVSSIPQKYSPKGFNIGRFMNYLLIKKTDPVTCIYRKFGLNSPATVFIGIKIRRTVTVKTHKDLLRFVFSQEGELITEIKYDGFRYVCMNHSLFKDNGSNNLLPIFLSTYDGEHFRLGIKVFSRSINLINPGLATTIMSSLIPLILAGGGNVTLEKINTVCKWTCKSPDILPVRQLTPGLGLKIAKYHEESWKNG